jgi:hypothetical protein
MQFDNPSEALPLCERFLSHCFEGLGQRLALRFVLVVGLVIFLAVVGIDSWHQASAADMTAAPHDVTATMESGPRQANVSGHQLDTLAIRADLAPSDWRFNVATAERLGHPDLTSARLTRSRLTTAHLFSQAAQ